MTVSPRRQWPCGSFSRNELEQFDNSGFRLYLSEPDRVDFGEVLFWRMSTKIPLWLHPNSLTRCGLFFNFVMFLIPFLISPAIEGKMGAFAQDYGVMILCLAMAALQIVICALDALDGLHARGSNQCSPLGALLDHYFDSITVPMNFCSIVLLFDMQRIPAMIGVASGALIFNMQLLTNYYLNEEPRVVGPESQMAIALAQCVVAALYYCKHAEVIFYVSTSATITLGCVLAKYILLFVPKFIFDAQRRVILTQLAIFWTSYVIICAVYYAQWISTFEVCICCVIMSWDYNGQIVTHHVTKDTLPIFTPFYLLIPAGVVAEFYCFHTVFKHQLHVTTMLLWVLLGYKNWKHFVVIEQKIQSNYKVLS